MIIVCVNCSKKFEVNSELIPTTGRIIQCGSCNHTWFFKLKKNPTISDNIANNKRPFSKKKEKKDLNNQIDKIINSKDTALVKYQKKSNFTLSKFLSYIIVTIVTFIGLVLILDTFKFQLYILFPSLEILLFSLFETLKDINLFIKDLI
tara:strand:+ start:54 stop:500 length:447 start_codon:yes stop_codon:yes gene_type:complete